MANQIIAQDTSYEVEEGEKKWINAKNSTGASKANGYIGHLVPTGAGAGYVLTALPAGASNVVVCVVDDPQPGSAIPDGKYGLCRVAGPIAATGLKSEAHTASNALRVKTGVVEEIAAAWTGGTTELGVTETTNAVAGTTATIRLMDKRLTLTVA